MMRTLGYDLLEKAKPGLLLAQSLESKLSYDIQNDAVPIAGSVPTVYRRLSTLEQLGLASVNRSRFEINRATRQPFYVLKELIPSLLALKNARRFGRTYNDSDVDFAQNILPDNTLVTLDYKAWDLTKFQSPLDFFVYVDDLYDVAQHLKENGFSEGKKGRIVLLSKQGTFTNMIQRVYLDCLAKGGRATLDAIAIQLLYGDQLDIKGQFSIDDVLKVQEDMQVGTNIKTVSQ